MNVSTFEDGKLVSPYLGIDSILDGVKKTNELNNKAYGVLVCLSVCDVLFNENTKKNLNDEFDSMILECNTDEDFRHVDEMLNKAALEGGYAGTFYTEIRDKINADYRNTLTKKSNVNRGPISYMDENNKLCSPYFDVTFRPTGYKNFKLDMACSGLLMTLSVTDLKRDDESQIRLLGDFCDILLAAKSEEDHIMIKVFLDELVKNGGYAVEFNEQVRALTGLANRNNVINIKNTVNQQLQVNEPVEAVQEVSAPVQAAPVQEKTQVTNNVPMPQIQISTDINGETPTEMFDLDLPVAEPDVSKMKVNVDPLVQDFKDSYEKFNERLNNGEDLEILLRNGRRLQDQLLDCMKKMDREEFDRLDKELEDKIKDIRMKMSS